MEWEAYNSYLEVDFRKMKRNIDKIQRHIGNQVDILPVIKGNAYGMGLQSVGHFLFDHCHIDTLGCAQVWEALQLLENHEDKSVLVVSGVPYNHIPLVVQKNIQTPVFHKEYIDLLHEEAMRQQKQIAVQIKIETGLGRIGVKPGKDLIDFCTYVATLPLIEVVGLYTHFASSEEVNHDFTMEQFQLFKQAIKEVKNFSFPLRYIHAFSSSSSVWLSDEEITHIRPAGLLFGFDVNQNQLNALELEEMLSWKSFITNVKLVYPGESVGYNRHFAPTETRKIATVAMGYGDGLYRSLGVGGAHMLVRGQRAEIVAICMDQLFLDVTQIEGVTFNDIVTIIGRDKEEFISVLELQANMGHTYISTLAPITQRVKRKYIYE